MGDRRPGSRLRPPGCLRVAPGALLQRLWRSRGTGDLGRRQPLDRRPYDAAVGFEGEGILPEFYRGWEAYQRGVLGASAPLDQAELDFAAATHLWSVRTLACHVISARAWWFHTWMAEGSPEFGRMVDWDEDEGLATRPAVEIVRGLEESWSVIKSGLERWSPDDLAKEFERPRPNQPGNAPTGLRHGIPRH